MHCCKITNLLLFMLIGHLLYVIDVFFVKLALNYIFDSSLPQCFHCSVIYTCVVVSVTVRTLFIQIVFSFNLFNLALALFLQPNLVNLQLFSHALSNYRFHIGAYEATKYKRENKNQRRFNIFPTTCTLPPEVHKFWFNLCLEIAIANLRVRSVIQPLYIPYKCILLIVLPIIALNLAPTDISTPNNEQHHKGSGRSPGKTPRVWLNVRYTKLHVVILHATLMTILLVVIIL